MKNIKFLIIILFIAGFIQSCDDKITSLEDLNTAPYFQYFRKSSINWETPGDVPIQDSAKVYNSYNNATYPAILRIKDANYNISKINIISNDTQNSFFVNDNVYYNNYEIDNSEEFNIAFRNNTAGTFDYKVSASDDFDKSNRMAFRITFKPNQDPIARLNISIVNSTTRNYLLNAHSSIDRDQSIGGSIVEYEYTIDNVIIHTSQPQINHIFTRGNHTVKLRVKDNDNVWSPYVQYAVTVI